VIIYGSLGRFLALAMLVESLVNGMEFDITVLQGK
jgi:hypothetical protein